jgi:hypothetical protein
MWHFEEKPQLSAHTSMFQLCQKKNSYALYMDYKDIFGKPYFKMSEF